MNKTDTIEKVYYSIGEVADMFNVATSQLRFWESELPLLKPKKNSRGNRKYTKDDVAVIRKITTLMREEGFTLSGVKKQLDKQENLGFCPCCGQSEISDFKDVIQNVFEQVFFMREDQKNYYRDPSYTTASLMMDSEKTVDEIISQIIKPEVAEAWRKSKMEKEVNNG